MRINDSRLHEKDLANIHQVCRYRRFSHKVSDYGITEQGKYSGKYALSEKLFCGECGSVYRRKMWKIGGKRKPVWRCLNRLEHGTQFCHDSITLDEDKLHQAICIGLNQVSQVKEKALDLISTNLMYAVTGDSNIMDAYAIEQTISRVKAEMDNAVEKCSKTEGDVCFGQSNRGHKGQEICRSSGSGQAEGGEVICRSECTSFFVRLRK